jgi:hypothetical protein
VPEELETISRRFPGYWDLRRAKVSCDGNQYWMLRRAHVTRQKESVKDVLHSLCRLHPFPVGQNSCLCLAQPLGCLSCHIWRQMLCQVELAAD